MPWLGISQVRWVLLVTFAFGAVLACGALQCNELITDAISKADRASGILWCSLLIAVFTAVEVSVVTLFTPTKRSPFVPMGEAKWSFSQSWATNITLLGAALGTALFSVALPSTTFYLEGSVYAGFSVLFATMTLVAPLLYVCLTLTPQPRGDPLTFLLAGALTEWAVLGQLATMTFLLLEITRDGAFSPGSTRLLWGLPVVGILLVILYCFKTMYSTLSEGPKAVDAAARVQLPL